MTALNDIDSALADIADLGYLVNNLFQLSDGSWQCNLRRGNIGSRYYTTAFAVGSTCAEALEAATHTLSTEIEHSAPPACASIDSTPILDLDTILAAIQPARITILRRKIT